MEIKKRNSLILKRKVDFILLAIALILLVFSAFLWFSKPLKIITFDIKFAVGENIGFDLNSSELNFGKLAPGGSSQKSFILQNEYNFPIETKVFLSNNLLGLISVEKEYSLAPGQEIKIPVTLQIPKNYSFGNYSGKIMFKFWKD